MSIENTIKTHMKASGDFERCGLVVEKMYGDLFVPCKNIHPIPSGNFLISSHDFVRASINGKIKAVVHSHVNGINKLSSIDRCCQYINRYEYWLYCDGELTKHNPISKLKGREFKEGFVDCYDSMKDFFYLCGVDLGCYNPCDGFRIPDWHKEDGAKSPFIENLAREGFFQVERMEDMIEGDVIISLLGSNVPNHSLVYLGNNRVFHHLPERLSGVEPLREYFVKMKHSIWRRLDYKDLPFSDVISILDRENN